MSFDDFITLVEGEVERQNLEFKGSVNWDVVLFAPSILAMSNLRDGGWIVVGIQDDPVVLLGLSDAQSATFNREHMMDQTAEFGVPSPQIDISKVEGPIKDTVLNFVVIRVHSFQVVPVICRKDTRKTKRGAIYYRNSNGKPQSAIISSETDMRDVIEIAAVRQIQRWQTLGLLDNDMPNKNSTINVDKFNLELDGL